MKSSTPSVYRPGTRCWSPAAARSDLYAVAGALAAHAVAIVRALHLEAHVDTTLYAPADARVVLHRATMRAWIDGVKCLLTETLFRLLDFFLQHPGEPSNTKDIAEYVAKGRQHEDTTRKAIDALGAAVEKSFKASKRKPPEDLARFITQPRRGHYVLNVVGFVD